MLNCSAVTVSWSKYDTAACLLVMLHAGLTLEMVVIFSCSERGVKTVRIGVFWLVAPRRSVVSEVHTASSFSTAMLLATSRLLVVACIVSSDRTVDERRVKVSGSYRGSLLALWG